MRLVKNLEVTCCVLGLAQLGSWSLFTRDGSPDISRRDKDSEVTACDTWEPLVLCLFALRKDAGRDFREVCGDKEGSWSWPCVGSFILAPDLPCLLLAKGPSLQCPNWPCCPKPFQHSREGPRVKWFINLARSFCPGTLIYWSIRKGKKFCLGFQ